MSYNLHVLYRTDAISQAFSSGSLGEVPILISAVGQFANDPLETEPDEKVARLNFL